MNDYSYIVIGTVFFVLGVIIGSAFFISILNAMSKDITEKESTDKEQEDDSEEKSLLKERLGCEKDSWTEMNCIYDKTDVKDTILKNQKKEDNCYHYTKRKKQSF